MVTRQLPEYYTDAVGPGWTPILEQLHTDLLAVAPHYGVVQVKEKFGLLRVYLINLPADRPERATTLVHAAEERSAMVCEECGHFGALCNDFSWFKTLCPECRILRQERRAGD